MNPGRKQEHGIWQWNAPVLACRECVISRIIGISQASPKRSPWPFPVSYEFNVHFVYVHCSPVSSPVLQWLPSWTQLLLLKEERKAMIFKNPLGIGIFVLTVWIPYFRAVVRLCCFFSLRISIPGGSDLWSTLTSLSSEIPLNQTKDFRAQKVLLC